MCSTGLADLITAASTSRSPPDSCWADHCGDRHGSAVWAGALRRFPPIHGDRPSRPIVATHVGGRSCGRGVRRFVLDATVSVAYTGRRRCTCTSTDAGRPPAGFGVGAASLVAGLAVGIILLPAARQQRIPSRRAGFVSIVSMIPGSYLFTMASGLLQIARGENIAPRADQHCARQWHECDAHYPSHQPRPRYPKVRLGLPG